MATQRMNKAAELGPAELPWWQDWRGECVAIIGAGPSAKTAPVAMLENRIHAIAINNSYLLAPFAEILYSCDFAWWQHHKGAKDFKGLRLSHDSRACSDFCGAIKKTCGNPFVYVPIEM